VFVGPDVAQDTALIDPTTIYFPYSITFIDSNSPSRFQSYMAAQDNENTGYYSAYSLFGHALPNNPNVSLNLSVRGTNNSAGLSFNVNPGVSASSLTYAKNSSTKWQVNDVGDMTYIKGVGYFWPLTNALSGQALVSDGNTPQQLSWVTLAVGGELWTNDTVLGLGRVIRPVDQSRSVYGNLVGTNFNGVQFILTDTNNDANTVGAAFYNSTTNAGNKALFFQNGQVGLVGESQPIVNPGAIQACTAWAGYPSRRSITRPTWA
jgi:hypothetical protein